jgi:hypothetical protein
VLYLRRLTQHRAQRPGKCVIGDRLSAVPLTPDPGLVEFDENGERHFWHLLDPYGVISLGQFGSRGIPYTRVGGCLLWPARQCLITNKPFCSVIGPCMAAARLKGLDIYR